MELSSSNCFDVDIVGDIRVPQGPPTVTAPKPEYMLTTIVTISVAVSLAQVFARQFDYTADSSQEFIAYGAMNVVRGFFSSFTAAGSLSHSSIQANLGERHSWCPPPSFLSFWSASAFFLSYY